MKASIPRTFVGQLSALVALAKGQKESRPETERLAQAAPKRIEYLNQ